jgi:hypothetical protein
LHQCSNTDPTLDLTYHPDNTELLSSGQQQPELSLLKNIKLGKNEFFILANIGKDFIG